MRCRTHNCPAKAQVWISKGGIAKKVCQDCADELIALAGWVAR